MKLFPFWDCVAHAEKLANDGNLVFQEFLCEKCGAKQTMPTPNRFYVLGKCEECNHITDIEKDGCNYMLVSISMPPPNGST